MSLLYTNYEITIHSKSEPLIVSDIQKVQNQLSLLNKMLERGEKVAEKGLLISGHSSQDIDSFFSKGSYAICARDRATLEVVGYVLAKPKMVLKDYFPTESIERIDSKECNLNGQDVFSRKIEYIDQIGVLFKYHKKKVSANLINTFYAMNPDSIAVCLVMTKPILNSRSLTFFNKNKFQKIAKIKLKKFGMASNFEGLLLAKNNKLI